MITENNSLLNIELNMKLKSILPLVLVCIAILLSCDGNKTNKIEDNKTQASEVVRINTWFNEVFEENLMDSPQFLSTLGRKDRQGELNDISETHSIKNLEKAKKDLTALLKFDPNKLDEQANLSFRLYKQILEREIEYEKYRHYNYPVNQMHGVQAELPSFMLNTHKIDNKEDAIAYVSRLNAFKPLFDQLIENLKIRADKGIVPPKFVFNHLYSDCYNIIGNPNTISNNLFIIDLISKLDAIDLSEKEKKEIIGSAEIAVKESVIVAYENLVAYLKELEEKATTDDGVWKFEDGNNFYKYRLEEITTTKLSSDEIFNTGRSEVERIHKEMNAIIQQVNFKGTLQDFFKFMKEDKQFYYEDGQVGKDKMILDYEAIVDSMEVRLDDVFYTKPKARMEVKAVEEWREKSAGKAFYQQGSPDGTRKGIFYANLYKMADMPTYEMEALAYHEGIPGHHMQISISQELTDLPEFRKYNSYTSYIEGWGLYCELLPKEMGFYSNPYSDFGRLTMELWRACRLVVDTGIHDKKWTREEAIKFLMNNTPNSENACTKAIERYIVMPGQATAYTIGMLHILKMREKAKTALEENFEVQEFHDIFLRSGAVPLNIFEENINGWILSEKNK